MTYPNERVLKDPLAGPRDCRCICRPGNSLDFPPHVLEEFAIGKAVLIARVTFEPLELRTQTIDDRPDICSIPGFEMRQLLPHNRAAALGRVRTSDRAHPTVHISSRRRVSEDFQDHARANSLAPGDARMRWNVPCNADRDAELRVGVV
jgi:hypothetical protein